MSFRILRALFGGGQTIGRFASVSLDWLWQWHFARAKSSAWWRSAWPTRPPDPRRLVGGHPGEPVVPEVVFPMPQRVDHHLRNGRHKS
jgi:hypothetical protein